MMNKKGLFVLSNTSQFYGKGMATGFFFCELAVVYEELLKQGWEIDIISPKGGYCPIEPLSLQSKFMSDSLWNLLGDPAFQQKFSDSKSPESLSNTDDYSLIYFTGGHGCCYDFKDVPKIHQITRKIYEKKGVVAAICHGQIALINQTLTDGTYLMAGKKFTCWSTAEEYSFRYNDKVPLWQVPELENCGGKWSGASPGQACVVADDNLITGQNPPSSWLLAQEIIKYWNSLGI